MASNKFLNNTKKKPKRKYRKSAKSNAKVTQYINKFNQMSNNTIKYDENKEKTKSKKQQNKNTKNKYEKHPRHSTNSIHPTPPLQIQKYQKQSKKKKRKSPKNKTKQKRKSPNKYTTKNNTVPKRKDSFKETTKRPAHIKQPSLSQSATTFETDTLYTITMTTPKLMDKQSSHSSLSDHFAATTLPDLGDIATQALAKIAEDKDDINIYNMDLIDTNTHSEHVKSTSIIALTAQAPKMAYDIPNMRAWNTIADMKLALPMKVNIGQCKLFCGGRELNDDDTLAQLDITDTSKVKLLLSWRYFEPDPNAVDAREIEHGHMDMVKELKEINDFKIFNHLMDEILKVRYDIALERSVKMILHSYCICLSGDRTFERNWTQLHTICYDYQYNVGDVEEILKYNNIYIDTWPHSGNDTPLRIAISNHLHNVELIDLVEFLVLNGARRMIRQTVFNLKRNVNDALYKDMDVNIRRQLIEILEPHIDEDPFKGDKL